jgi:hypothetical protein
VGAVLSAQIERSITGDAVAGRGLARLVYYTLILVNVGLWCNATFALHRLDGRDAFVSVAAALVSWRAIKALGTRF